MPPAAFLMAAISKAIGRCKEHPSFDAARRARDCIARIGANVELEVSDRHEQKHAGPTRAMRSHLDALRTT
jgi:hypothetical protein